MKQTYTLIYLALLLSMHMHAEQEQPTNTHVQQEQHQPIVDLREALDTDYAFFNDPYLQAELQPLHDLTQVGLGPKGIIKKEEAPEGAHEPIVDPSEAFDVDFSYFNDPYAFEKFRKLPIKAILSGYVQHSAWWDSRQVVGLVEDYILFFPKKRVFDVDCNDINSRGQFNMTMVETRIRGELYGPKVLGANTFAYIETDFIGDAVFINRLRVRNAFLQMTWEKATVLMGQFWSPMFIIKTFPLTVAFDGGVPIELFARSPQVRITANVGNTELVFAALSQLDFVSNGPIGFSTTYLRNARIPELIARIAHQREHVYAGAGVSFLRLKPRLESNKGFKVREYINSVRCVLFGTVKFEPLEIRSSFSYSENGTNLAGISGYAVATVNPTTDERTYTNTRAISSWLDINVNKRIEPGIFIGVTKNLGAGRQIIPCVYNPKTDEDEHTIYTLFGDAEQLDTVFEVTPRIRFHVLPVDFAFEYRYIRAGFGCIDQRARPHNIDPVSDNRILFTAYYYF